VAADKLAYMSYRIGDDIYWTRRQIRLHRGETILTNGRIELRGRCGNAISVDPMVPTAESEPGPLELEALAARESSVLSSHPLGLDYAAQGGIPLTFGPNDPLGSTLASRGLIGGLQSPSASELHTEALPRDPVLPFMEIGTPSTTSPSPETPGFDLAPEPPGDGGIPTVLVTIPGGLESSTIADFNGGGRQESASTVPPPEGPSTPVPTPEPGTFLLIGGGLVSMVVAKLRSRG
jgi:hypothetical protein